MDYETSISLEECFSDRPDPCVQGRCDHKLMVIFSSPHQKRFRAAMDRVI